MKRGKTASLKPRAASLAHYQTPYNGLSRQRCPVRVITEAVGDRMVVEIIEHAVLPVRETVKSIYLSPLPSLFDTLESSL